MTAGVMELARLAGGSRIDCTVREPDGCCDSRDGGQQEAKRAVRQRSGTAVLHVLLLIGGSPATRLYFSASSPEQLMPLLTRYVAVWRRAPRAWGK